MIEHITEKRTSAITGATGEHYVAYVLSSLGYPTAMTRGGSPTIDLMVGELSGNITASIQVKTSNWAWRGYKKKTENNHWEWDIGAKGITLKGNSIFYALVDLRWNPEINFPLNVPHVYIVPSRVIADAFGPGWSRYMFWIMEYQKHEYFERSDLITDYLRTGGQREE